MANEITIPILPTRSIDETVTFYVALGFEVIYRQARPNAYACVKFEDIELHFFTMKGYEPKNSYSTCYVGVPDLAGLHQVFCDGLRSHFGRLPIAGIPRISKLNNSNSDKQLRFNVVDPGGNWIRFGQTGAQPAESDDTAVPQSAETKLARATRSADWLVEAKGDFEAAAQMLDKALADREAASPVDRVRALVLRASLAVSLDDPQLARTLLSEVRGLPLDEDDRAALTAEMQRADDLEKAIGA